MVLENKEYVPTLAVRASEMNGMEYLPAKSKDRMTPCFLLAPWANSSALDRTITRIERAFPNRNYFLDIDRNYVFSDVESAPQQELRALLDPANNYSNWIAFVERHRRVWPCIQMGDQSSISIGAQIEAFQSQGRSYGMRIVRGRVPENLDEVVGAFAERGTADYVIILEGGWTDDPLSLAVWFGGMIGGSLQAIDANVPIVLSCTSIPKLFTPFSSSSAAIVPFNNRQLVDQIRRSSNRARVIYGDWGSTRPRESSGFANRPIDRIDYPTETAWHIARNKEDEWDFRDAALRIVGSPIWDGNLGVWGEEMIENTTINKELGIDTPQKNVAARVNIHLHMQAFFGMPHLEPRDFDEDWQDDEF